MSAGRRLALIAVAVAVAVGAFVVLSPDEAGEEQDEQGAPVQTRTEPTATARSAPEPPGSDLLRVVSITVAGGRPVGALTRVAVPKGAPVEIRVSSDSPQHVHLHGYDIVRDAAPGSPARFRFQAGVEGIFEIELEGPGVQIAELRVEP